MPRFNPPADPTTKAIARVTIGTKTAGSICLTTFDYQWNTAATSPTLTDLNNLGNDWHTAFDTDFLACLSPQTSLYSTTVAELHYGTSPTYSVLDAPGTVGTAGATALNLELGVTMTRYGPLKGQHGRGRITMPAVPNTFVTPATDSNVINATGLTAYNALAAGLVSPLVRGGSTWTPFISTRPVPPSTLVDFGVLISNYAVRTIMGTARTRKEGRGI